MHEGPKWIFAGESCRSGIVGGAQVGFFELAAALFERGLQADLPARKPREGPRLGKWGEGRRGVE